jgi:hypothetical protein
MAQASTPWYTIACWTPLLEQLLVNCIKLAERYIGKPLFKQVLLGTPLFISTPFLINTPLLEQIFDLSYWLLEFEVLKYEELSCKSSIFKSDTVPSQVHADMKEGTHVSPHRCIPIGSNARTHLLTGVAQHIQLPKYNIVSQVNFCVWKQFTTT